MYVHVSCRKNYVRTRGVNSSSAEVSYRKPRTSSGELNFGKDCFYCGCVFTERERERLCFYREREREREKETKKSCNISCKNREVDKAVHQAIIDRIDDEWCIDVKGRYACVNTQCTIYSVVQIFRLVKVIQRKALC